MEGNGITLETLVERLEALEIENAGLRREVAALKKPGTPRAVETANGEGRVSRRALLTKTGAAAVAAVAAGMLLSPREANAEDFDLVFTKFLTVDGDDRPGRAILAWNNDGQFAAVETINHGSGTAVLATGGIGVEGVGRNAAGVWGRTSVTGNEGVYGQHTGTSGFGVVGDGKGSNAGVLGRNPGGTGVRGEGSTTAEVAGVRGTGKTGVWGSTSATGYSGVYGQHTGSSGYGIVGDGKGGSAGVLGRNSGGTGVRGEGSTTAEVAGVRGTGSTGVWGSSSRTGYSGVHGQHTGTSGFGVVGDGKGGGTGVLGRNPGGTGVRGESSAVGSPAVLGRHSDRGFGVSGECTGGVGVWGTGKNGVVGDSSTPGQAAVAGEHSGSTGYGVEGIGAGTAAGVLGRNPDVVGGEGVRGEGRTGVYGKASVATGYGATFEGGRAQLRLVPKTTAGRPATGTHVKGEIYMDTAGSLFVCVANGTPGTWRRVTMS